MRRRRIREKNSLSQLYCDLIRYECLLTNSWTVFSIQKEKLPDDALLQGYRLSNCYTDCYATTIQASVSFTEFVFAFYTTPLFKLERLILKWAVKKPSSDEDARQLSVGDRQSFAAWAVEGRTDNQLLMCDFRSRTRSWFMLVQVSGDDGVGSRLYFGSAVVPTTVSKTGNKTMGPLFRALIGFHKLYSVALLLSAKVRLN